MVKVYVSSGGGIRVGASFAAVREGERQGKFKASSFNAFIGTSAGALDAALTANGWDGRAKLDLFHTTNWAKLFKPPLMPFAMRKTLALKWPMSLANLSDFIDDLNLRPVDGLIVNTVDSETNTHIAYCEKKPAWWPSDAKATLVEKAFSDHGFGTIITRSMALPGIVADDPRYKDGGIAENPLMSVLPTDADILLIHLGYAGLVKQGGNTVPKGLISESMYAYEFKAYSFIEHLMAHYSRLRAIYPKVYDTDSTAFNLSASQKLAMVTASQKNTQPQWAVF